MKAGNHILIAESVEIHPSNILKGEFNDNVIFHHEISTIIHFLCNIPCVD